MDVSPPEGSVMEEVTVRRGSAPPPPLCTPVLCHACVLQAGLKRVPHESGSGTAALSGDKVIRTGNNERERKS